MRSSIASVLIACVVLCACNGLLGINSLENVDCSADATDFSVGKPAVCTFSTITDAVAAAQKSRAPSRTIHVAAGTYSVASGEKFPIDLRGGISLEGESAGSHAVIVGIGALSHALEGGSRNGAMSVTFLTGSLDTASRIAHLDVSSDAAASPASYGIFCDRGNAQATLPEPPPNLVVDDVVIGAAYEIGLMVSNSTTPHSGCNARITRSTVSIGNTLGVKVGDCDGSQGSAVMALEVGDGTAENGNHFEGVGVSDHGGGGILIGTCAASTLVSNNTFYKGGAGVYSDPNGPADVRIRGNTFDSNAGGGIHIVSGTVAEITNNTFRAANFGAVWADVGAVGIASARGNSFIGNRTGVVIEATTGVFDFGTASSAGGNDFRCNSVLPLQRGDGFDVGAGNFAAGVFSVVGNSWDHLPPTTVSSDNLTGADGVDILTPHGNGPAPIVGNSTLSSSACPATNRP